MKLFMYLVVVALLLLYDVTNKASFDNISVSSTADCFFSQSDKKFLTVCEFRRFVQFYFCDV